MKNIKVYESFQKELKIDLLLLCELVGGLYNAIEILIKLSNNCSKYDIIYHDEILSDNRFEHGKISYSDLYDKSKSEAIKLTGSTMSYGFLLSNPTKNNLYFIFYDVNDEQDINTKIAANKYNI